MLAVSRRLFLLPLAAIALAGCPDPQGQFDDFGKRYEKTMGGSSSSGAGGAVACTAPAVGAADGTYMFALTATKLAPKKPLAFKAELTTQMGPNGLQFSMKTTPLSYMDRMTAVQAPLMLGPYDVAADGSFDAPIGTLMITGMANPITMADITTSGVVLHGHLCKETPNFMCGTVDGMVTMPITFDLAGSTFTMQKAQNGMLPAPVTDCAMDPSMYP